MSIPKAGSAKTSMPKKFLFSLLLVIVLISAGIFVYRYITSDENSQQSNPETIRIASFNLQILGDTKLGRTTTVQTLAAIINQFDLVALQEVGSSNSTTSSENSRRILDHFLLELNAQAGQNSYSYLYGNQYAILYRNKILTPNFSQVHPDSENFAYPPLLAGFRVLSGNFDFVLATIHTRPANAVEELASLAGLVETLAAAFNEPDIIMLGDFNADGSYYNEGSSEALAGFHQTITVIPNSADTSVAPGDNSYDRIQLSPAMQSDWTGRWGIFRFEEHFDASHILQLEGAETTAGTIAALSDHYPVWTVLYTNRDQD